MTGVLAGAVLGAAVQELLNTQLRLLAAIAVVLCVSLVAGVAALLSTLESRRQADEEISRNSKSLADDLEIEFQSLAASVTADIQRLSKQFGLKVEKVLLEELNSIESLSDDRTAQMVFSAQHELCVLDWLSDLGRWPDEAMEAGYSRRFFEELMNTIRSRPPEFKYRRIVQVRNPAELLANAATPGFVRHCHDMLDLRAARDHNISLRVARRRFPFKFILVDRDRLVLQLQRHGDSGEDLAIWGEILITDPAGGLVSIFRKIWDELDDGSNPVTKGDLPAAV
ncbi:hypothetical protein J5X84_18350 [Streptosporangiaceae bacterium NEAU-GS5]|nr:hypothetical protein [Streptosporangiaceae bacterium NEAU-GS5]